jgi:hypothetical protein
LLLFFATRVFPPLPRAPRLFFFSSLTLARPPPPNKTKHPPPSTKTQVKNASTTMLDGAVGRVYMPRQAQDLEKLALAKGKGVKRERRAAAAERQAKRHAPNAGGGGASSDGDE